MVSDGVDYSSEQDSCGSHSIGCGGPRQESVMTHGQRTTICFDIEGLKSWYGGNLQQLLGWFLEDSEIAVNKIRLHTANGELLQAGDVAHEIKGVSGTIGAKRMYEILVDLENACKTEDAAATKIFIDELAAEFQDVRELLKSI